MSIETGNRPRIAFAMMLALLLAGGFICATKTFSSMKPSGLDYFKGNWTVTMRGNPALSFSWTVKEDLRANWMTGVVERGGEKVSTDFWRLAGAGVERFAFTADGTFVKIEGRGWEADKMVLTGAASDKTGETKIRETITRVNDRKFYALWERQSADGKWTVFADEICTRSA